MRSRKYGYVVSESQNLSCDRIYLFDCVYFITEQLNSYCAFGACGIYVYNIASDSERASDKSEIVSGILDFNKLAEQLCTLFFHTGSE